MKQPHHKILILSLLIMTSCQQKRGSGAAPFDPVPVQNPDTGNNNTTSPIPTPGPIVIGAGKITINAGTDFTSGIKVALQIERANVTQMKISDNNTCTDGQWEPFVSQKIWTLKNPEQLNLVSVMFKDGKGQVSLCASSSITHDSSPPDVKVMLDPANTNYSLEPYRVHIQARDTGIGLKEVSCKLNGNTTPCPLDGQGVSNLDLLNLVEGAYFLQVFAADQLGNSSLQEIGWSIKNKIKSIDQAIALKEDNKVDILFVIDNSASLSAEQKNMASRMGTFLKEINNLDWQIGIATTDPRNIALGDGHLIPLTATALATYVIDSTVPLAQAQKVLSSAIQRPEVGSSHVQGVYATYRAIEHSFETSANPNKQLFRKNSSLVAIVISDKDESGNGIKNDPFELIKYIRTSWKGQKNFVFHSIIVKPGDKKCLVQEHTVYGKIYANLSKITGLGSIGGAIIGSVCEPDYASQLSGIGQSIQQIHQTLTLECEPIDGKIEIRLDEKIFNDPFELNGLKISFQNLPLGNYALKYTCLNK